MTTERERIDAFLSSRRLALIGASTRPEDFSRSVMRDMLARAYDVVPVNPKAMHPSEDESGRAGSPYPEIEGRRAYAHVSDIDPPVEAALVMTNAEASADVVSECAAAGVRRVWLHRGAGTGAVSDEAVRRAETLGLELVAGRCPMMFLAEPELTHSVHRIHRGFLKLADEYPAPATRDPVSPARRWGVAIGWGAVLWLVTALALAVGSATLTGDGGLIARAFVAPLAAFALSFGYHRIVGRLGPLALALVFVATVLALDTLIVAALFLGTFTAAADPDATWLPALLLFAATYIGTLVARPNSREPRKRHAHA